MGRFGNIRDHTWLLVKLVTTHSVVAVDRRAGGGWVGDDSEHCSYTVVEDGRIWWTSRSQRAIYSCCTQVLKRARGVTGAEGNRRSGNSTCDSLRAEGGWRRGM